VRDVLITLLVFGCLPIIFMRPYVGILVWSWLSYMNPHRLAWGFAYDMPFAQIVAITLLLGLVFNKEKHTLPIDRLLWVWLAFICWMCLSTVFALIPEAAFIALIKIIKIQLVTFLTLLLINSMYRIHQLIWVIVVSIGYYSVKGGLFTIITGGGSRVWGPPGSFIAENNSLALASLMIIPLMVYLWRCSGKQWVKIGLVAAIILSLASVLGSQSRGALLGIVAMGCFFWFKSSAKLISGIVIVALAVAGWILMPESWHTRMATISNYQQDNSAMGRINAWHYSVNVAGDRLSGAGLNSWSLETYAIYAPDPLNAQAAHSIYFSVLADHGWPGLIMFALILWMVWRSLGKVISSDRNTSTFAEEAYLAKMIKVSLVAYMSGGAFLSLSYFDLPWHLFAISLLIKSQQTPVDPRKTKDAGRYNNRGVASLISTKTTHSGPLYDG